MTTNSNPSRRWCSIAAVFAVSTMLLACGGDDDAQSDPSTTEESPTTAASSTTQQSVSTPATTSMTTVPAQSATTLATTTTAPAPTTEPATTQPTTTEPLIGLAALQPELQSLLEKYLDPSLFLGRETPTGSLLAVRIPGQDDLILGAGIDGLEGSDPIDPNAPFLASYVAARFTTATAMRMIDEGLLDAAATIDTWLPEVANADSITVEMLLDATSGLGGIDENLEAVVYADLERVWTPREVIAQATTIGEPGTFDMVSGGPGLGAANTALAAIIEDVTGQPFAATLEEFVAAPLGLMDTTVLGSDPIPPGLQDGVFELANGQRLEMSGVSGAAYHTFGAGAWNLATTATDLLDFTEAMVTGQLLGVETTARSLDFRSDRPDNRAFVVGRGLVFGYCLCDPATEPFEVRAIGFRGGTVGASTAALYFPLTGVTVVHHHNVAGNSPAALQRELYDLLGE